MTANIISGSLIFAAALLFGGLGGMLSERAGVINLGIEGFMISGAFFSAIGAYYAESAGMGGLSPFIGLLAAFICTTIFSGMHALATLKYKANHVISGVVINLLAANVTFFLVKLLFDGSAETPRLKNMFSKISIPFLSDIPIIGKALFSSYPTTYIAFAAVLLIGFIFFKTSLGLRLRGVGENPGSIDTAGINVMKIKFWAVMLSGSIASLGGATIVLTTNGNFSFNTISGQGYIAIAAVILGRWNPYGVLAGALLFGFAQSIKDQIQILDFANSIPTEVFYMLPYLVTLLALIFTGRKTRGPKALGIHYDASVR